MGKVGSIGRGHFDQRLAVRAESTQEAIDKLASFGKTGKASGLIVGTVDREFAIRFELAGVRHVVRDVATHEGERPDLAGDEVKSAANAYQY